MPQDVYDKVLILAKRRGFLYPSFEIYGGVAGFYDYGPLGSQLKNNLENLWRYFYLYKDSCLEINTPTITLYDVLKASGHVEEFTDLTVDCEECKTSFKVEDIIEDESSVEQAINDEDLICPTCGGKLINPHPVNLMFSTKIGVGKTRDAFLRPETAQGIFTGFHLLYRYAREKLPFGVIQLGKGYRNEVSPRQGPIRMREFSMAEAEVFFDPENKSHKNFSEVKDHTLYLYDNEKEFQLTMEEAVLNGVINNQALSYYMYLTQTILLQGGVDPKKFRFRKHADDELAHYAQECWDAELYSERFGWVECVGIADRSAYDIHAHIEASKTDMYALRKYDKPKLVKRKKIIPKMNILGPEFKDQAGAIKSIIEEMEVPGEIDRLTIQFKGKDITISNGTSYFFDFRENGEHGINLIKTALEHFPVKPFILSRPSELQSNEKEILRLLDISEGIGLSSITDWDFEDVERIASLTKKRKKLFALHVSERIREDIKKIITLKPDFIVHMTKGTKKDLLTIKKENMPIVICPQSNTFFNMTPPLKLMKEIGNTILIGTDNAMIHPPNLIDEINHIKHIAPDVFTIEQLLEMVTYVPRKVLNLKDDMHDATFPLSSYVILDERTLQPLINTTLMREMI